MELKRKLRFAAVAAVSLLFAFFFFHPIGMAKQALTGHYQAVPGTIIKRIGDEEVEFTYVVDGSRYFGNTITYYSHDTLGSIEAEVGELKQGAAVQVYVDPSDPSYAVLFKGATFSLSFGFVWCFMALIGSTVCILKILIPPRDEATQRQRYDEMTESTPEGLRLRLVPGGYKSPTAVAVTCFFGTFLLMYVVQLVPRFFNVAMEGGGDVTIFLWSRLFISLAIATIASIADYFYTAHGNAHSRWDLCVNHQTGELAIPAISAFRKPSRVRIEDVVGLELRTLISRKESDNDSEFHRLNVVCVHAEPRQLEDSQLESQTKKLSAYTVAQSDNPESLKAMASWLKDAAKLDLPLKESSANGVSFKELFSSKREFVTSA